MYTFDLWYKNINNDLYIKNYNKSTLFKFDLLLKVAENFIEDLLDESVILSSI